MTEKGWQENEPDTFSALAFTDNDAFDVPGLDQFEQSRAAQPFQPLFGFRHADPIIIGHHRGRQ